MEWNLFDKIDKKITNLRKKAKQDSLDARVRKIIASAMPQNKKGISSRVTREAEKCIAASLDYSKASKKPQHIESSKLYIKGFYKYASYYTKISYSGAGITARKVIEGPVRITMEKFIKLWQYLLAALNPQWNMPTLSKFDYDTLAPSVSNHTIIDKENLKYESGYEALKYRG